MSITAASSRGGRATAIGGLWLLFICAASVSDAASLGINWQSNHNGYGPYTVASEGPSAFGVLAEHWYEPGLDPGLEPAPQSGSGSFAVHGGAVNVTWTSSAWDTGTLVPQTAYGWAQANQPGVPSPPGDPLSPEAVVLSKFLFATGAGEYGDNAHPIVVTISGLESIADLSKGYTVRLISSSQNKVDQFTPGQISDNAGNVELVSLALLPETPVWWPPEATNPAYNSTGAVGSSTLAAFNGDTISIVLDGFNEAGTLGGGNFSRTTLSGVIIEFTPVPEPSTVLLLMGTCAVTALLFRRRF